MLKRQLRHLSRPFRSAELNVTEVGSGPPGRERESPQAARRRHLGLSSLQPSHRLRGLVKLHTNGPYCRGRMDAWEN